MKSRAFTLIELLVVISIISLLSSVVLASLNSAREKGRFAAAKQFSANIYHAEADQAVAIWDFNDGSGSGAVDSSGNQNALALIGGYSWSADTPSGTGYSLSLDGSTGYAEAADSNSLDIGTNDLTITAWGKTSSAASQRIVSKRFGALGMGYSLVIAPGGVPYIEILNNSTYITASAPVAANDGKWHLISGIISRSGSGFVCVDSQCGAKVNFAPMASDDLSNAVPVDVGRFSATGVSFFNGLLDEVRIFSKALTASEVGKLYASEMSRFKLADNK